MHGQDKMRLFYNWLAHQGHRSRKADSEKTSLFGPSGRLLGPLMKAFLDLLDDLGAESILVPIVRAIVRNGQCLSYPLVVTGRFETPPF